jgi:hypothetical protein
MGLVVSKKPGSKKKAKSDAVPKTREQANAEKQLLALWTLLGAGGAGFGGRLKPEIEKDERNALLQAGLIEFEKRKHGAYWLSVTEKGWDWAEQHLSEPLPDKNFGGAFVLRAWLSRLSEFLKARDLRLPEVLAAELQAPRLGRPTNVDFSELRERIRSACRDIAGDFNRRVLLRDLRAKLFDIDRDQLDTALKQMQQEGEVILTRIEYGPDLTDEDRSAALQIGAEPRHIVRLTK